MTIIAFLNKNFKPLMSHYYKLMYREDILKVLELFEYGVERDLTLKKIIDLLLHKNPNWPLRRAAKAYGICCYLNFIE